jgi:hypothetical protein
MKTFSFFFCRKTLFNISLILGLTLYFTLIQSQSYIGDLSSKGQNLESLPFNSKAASPSPSYWKTGALVGFGAGVIGSAIVVYQGGSKSLCDQSKNQDATSTGACVSIIGGSGLVMGGLGALIGSFVKKSVSEETSGRFNFKITEKPAYGHTVAIQWTF